MVDVEHSESQNYPHRFFATASPRNEDLSSLQGTKVRKVNRKTTHAVFLPRLRLAMTEERSNPGLTTSIKFI